MYYKRVSGQVAQKYTMVSGRHSRVTPSGCQRTILMPGDECHPTPRELASFPDKFVPVMVPVMVEDDDLLVEDEDEDASTMVETGAGDTAGDPPPDRFAGVNFGSDAAYEHARDQTDMTSEDFEGHDGTGDDDAFVLSDVESLAEGGWPTKKGFSSTQAYSAWVAKGKPNLAGVAKTGHGGETFAKKDVEGVE